MQWLIGNEYTLVGFLPARFSDEQLKEERSGEDDEMSVYGYKVSITVALESVVRAPANSVWREQRMTALHEAMRVVVGPLWESKLKGFLVKVRKPVGCRPLLVSYCYEISKAKNMSIVRHGVQMQRQLVRGMTTEEDIISGQMAYARSLGETRMVAKSLLQIPRNNISSAWVENEVAQKVKRESLGVAENYSLLLWLSFLETFMASPGVKEMSSYCLCIFGPLHNLYLGISKSVKEFTVNYLSSDSVILWTLV